MSTEVIENILSHSQKFIHGKEDKIKLALCTIFAGGHLLIEDVPGVGKTTLVKYLAKALGLNFSRIQFTNDLLPYDILGSSFFNKSTNEFIFKLGPIFGEVILADELNRAPPKTQSALLQAMEEKKISIDGETHQLPTPFIVMATQNPSGQIGTFELPESQLDRFMMKINMGYPDRESSMQLLSGKNPSTQLDSIKPLINREQFNNILQSISNTTVSSDIIEYIQNIVEESRRNNNYQPLSNRAGIDIVESSKTWAYMSGRDYVLPDDIQKLFPYVTAHRINNQNNDFQSLEESCRQFIEKIAVV